MVTILLFDSQETNACILDNEMGFFGIFESLCIHDEPFSSYLYFDVIKLSCIYEK